MADHIVAVPPYFLFILIAQIVLAVVVLGLAAYGCTFNDFFGGNGYAIFCVSILPILPILPIFSSTSEIH
jgi:hypothetical protein